MSLSPATGAEVSFFNSGGQLLEPKPTEFRPLCSLFSGSSSSTTTDNPTSVLLPSSMMAQHKRRFFSSSSDARSGDGRRQQQLLRSSPLQNRPWVVLSKLQRRSPVFSAAGPVLYAVSDQETPRVPVCNRTSMYCKSQRNPSNPFVLQFRSSIRNHRTPLPPPSLFPTSRLLSIFDFPRSSTSGHNWILFDLQLRIRVAH